MVLVFYRFHCNTYLHNMRRARIKALAAVPVRKKPLQDAADCIDANDVADKEKKEENVSNIDEIEQEVIKEVIKVKEQKEKGLTTTDILERKEQKEKDISTIDISKQKELKKENNTEIKREAIKDVAKVQEEIKKEENKVNLKESVIIKNSDSQKLCSPLKPDSQELHAQINFKESPSKVRPDKVIDHSVQKNILLPDVPTLDIGKDHVKRVRNLN